MDPEQRLAKAVGHRSLLRDVWDNRILNNRPLMYGGIALGLGAISFINQRQDLAYTSQVETWGTASLPHFKIIESERGIIPFTSYKSNLETRIEITRSKLEFQALSAEATKQLIAQLEINLSELKTTPNRSATLIKETVDSIDALYKKHFPAESATGIPSGVLAQSITESFLPTLTPPYTPDQQRDAQVLNDSKAVFKLLTGKAIPDSVKVSFVDPEVLVPHAGDCKEREEEIRVASRSYTLNTNTLLHEFGHLVCRQNEQEWDGSIKNNQQLVTARRVREEAAAKCFEAAAYCNPELSDNAWIIQNSDRMIDASMSGNYS